MTVIEANPVLGVGLHAIGACFAAFCYTPQKLVKRWSWQTYWIVQASFCWLILPVVVAYLTIPDLMGVLAEAPKSAMLWALFLGMVYGIGGTSFGLAIKHIGLSLTYAIAIGLSCIVGTLVPPLVEGTLGEKLSKAGAHWVIAGIVVGVLGIAISGWAGRQKEKDLEGTAQKGQFNLAKGLAISILAGVISAFYGFAMNAGKPIADVAEKAGADVFSGNVVYIFSNTGAFITTLIYCLYLQNKEKTSKEFTKLPKGEGKASISLNYVMAFLTGCFWYGQFFFYNLGHVRMGDYKFVSWGIHMIMLVLFSTIVGLIFKEWLKCRVRTYVAVGLAFFVLLGSILLIANGNKIAEDADKASKASAAVIPPAKAQ